MKYFRHVRLLAAVSSLFLWCAATAHTQEKVTVRTQGEGKVTVNTDAAGKVTIRHEALADVYDHPDVSITVKKAPPEPKPEVVVVESRPDDDAIWVPGYWQWNTTTSDYEWISGTWRRQIPNSTWHPGKWANVNDEWIWHPGYWGSESETTMIIAKEAPPEAKVEVKSDPPGTDYVWVPGVWKYDAGAYKWIPGTWERAAGSNMTYIPGKWVKTAAGYQYIPGHWDYTPETRTYVIKSN